MLALIVSARAGRAGPNEDAAREATRKGAAAYNLGSYEEAARHYEAAYRLVQDPALLFNLGQSWRLGGQPDKALTAYRAYLRTAPDDAAKRELVERRIEELERLVGAPGRPTAAAPPSPPPLATPVPAGATDGAPALTASALPEEKPVYQRWWFWAGAGAVIAGVAVTAVLLSSRGGTQVPTTPLGNQSLFR
jgi:tetratricopeptide (TPR) repeat protein